MNANPNELKPHEFVYFINANQICVVRAGLDYSATFNLTLYSQLKLYFKQTSNLGTVNLQNIDYSEVYINKLIKEQMCHIGLVSSDTMLPGYYLFKRGSLVAYHPGTFDISKLDPNSQKSTIFFGLAFAVFAGILQRSFSSGLLTFAAAMEVPAGMGIFQFFREILESKSEIGSLKQQQNVFLNELENAYALLNISKTANDIEIKNAWKKMLVEFHPDKDKNNKETRTKLTVQINEAYDIITYDRKALKTF